MRITPMMRRLAGEDPQDSELLAAAPKLFKALSHAAPIRALLALSEKYGGTRIYVPMMPHKDYLLGSILGESAFQALCDLRGGEYVYVPKAERLCARLRNREIVALATSRTARAIAIKFGLAQRTVFSILAKAGGRRRALAPAHVPPGSRLVQPMKTGGTP